MSEKAQYRTRQITELENYLCSMEGKHVTVSDICKYFKSQGISIGTTTVYRQLDRMVEQGLVAKYVVDGTSSACFEYLGHDEHCHKHICFHCKCEKCGKVIHLECGEMAHLGEHMLADHGFQWDFTRTVFMESVRSVEENNEVEHAQIKNKFKRLFMSAATIGTAMPSCRLRCRCGSRN